MFLNTYLQTITRNLCILIEASKILCSQYVSISFSLKRTNTTPSLCPEKKEKKKISRDFAKTFMMLGDLIQETFLGKTSSNTLTFNDNKDLALHKFR